MCCTDQSFAPSLSSFFTLSIRRLSPATRPANNLKNVRAGAAPASSLLRGCHTVPTVSAAVSTQGQFKRWSIRLTKRNYHLSCGG